MLPPDLAMLTLDTLGLDSPISLSTAGETIYERAAKIIERDGDMSPVVFLFTDSAVYLMESSQFFSTVARQNELAWVIRKLTHEEDDIICVAVATQGYKNSENEEAEELLVVQCEWYDGSQRMFSGTVRRDTPDGASGATVIGPAVVDSYPGIFSTLFSPTKQGGLLN